MKMAKSSAVRKPKQPEKMDLKLKKCTTPVFRVSFPHVFEAKAIVEGQEPKYSIAMLFDKKTDLAPLKKAVQNAILEKYGTTEKDELPENFRMPFRNGDTKTDLAGYAGTIFVNASSKQKPGLVDKDLNPILDKEEFYPGCYARATLIAFCYDVSGNSGVSFSLQNIQKVKDGESLSGKKKAEDEFEVIEDDSDSEENYSDDDLGI